MSVERLLAELLVPAKGTTFNGRTRAILGYRVIRFEINDFGNAKLWKIHVTFPVYEEKNVICK